MVTVCQSWPTLAKSYTFSGAFPSPVPHRVAQAHSMCALLGQKTQCLCLGPSLLDGLCPSGFPGLLPALVFWAAALGPLRACPAVQTLPQKLPPTLPLLSGTTASQRQLPTPPPNPFSRTHASGDTTPAHPKSSPAISFRESDLSEIKIISLPWASVSPICEMKRFTICLSSIVTQSESN